MLKSSIFRNAAAAIMLAAGAFAPALASRQHQVVINQPGERLLPPPPKKRKTLTPQDLERIERAAAKRAMRGRKLGWARWNGGWDATDRWLVALAERQEAARAKAAGETVAVPR